MVYLSSFREEVATDPKRQKQLEPKPCAYQDVRGSGSAGSGFLTPRAAAKSALSGSVTLSDAAAQAASGSEELLPAASKMDLLAEMVVGMGDPSDLRPVSLDNMEYLAGERLYSRSPLSWLRLWRDNRRLFPRRDYDPDFPLLMGVCTPQEREALTELKVFNRRRYHIVVIGTKSCDGKITQNCHLMELEGTRAANVRRFLHEDVGLIVPRDFIPMTSCVLFHDPEAGSARYHGGSYPSIMHGIVSHEKFDFFFN